MDPELTAIKQKVDKYKKILVNTEENRKDWNNRLKKVIVDTLEYIAKDTGLEAEVEIQDNIENMELLVFNLGRTTSGISEKVDETVRKPMIKSNGALIYQQLFNGKLLVLISIPSIEGYGDPRPPKTVEILRPDEINQKVIYHHVEQFLTEITDWEDYDDDLPQQTSVFNPIGFNKNIILEED